MIKYQGTGVIQMAIPTLKEDTWKTRTNRLQGVTSKQEPEGCHYSFGDSVVESSNSSVELVEKSVTSAGDVWSLPTPWPLLFRGVSQQEVTL